MNVIRFQIIAPPEEKSSFVSGAHTDRERSREFVSKFVSRDQESEPPAHQEDSIIVGGPKSAIGKAIELLEKSQTPLANKLMRPLFGALAQMNYVNRFAVLLFVWRFVLGIIFSIADVQIHVDQGQRLWSWIQDLLNLMDALNAMKAAQVVGRSMDDGLPEDSMYPDEFCDAARCTCWRALPVTVCFLVCGCP